MKKFKVTMLGTVLKEVFVAAKNKEEAVNKVDKYYLDNEGFDFEFEDLRTLKYACKEIQSKRREILTSTSPDIPKSYAMEFVDLVIDKFHNANKCITSKGMLEIRLNKNDIRELEKAYEECKKEGNL